MSMYVVVEIQDGDVTIHPQGYDTLQDIINAFYDDATAERNSETGDLELADMMENDAVDLDAQLAGEDGDLIEVELSFDRQIKIQKI